jgi:peptidoglycan-associated lipoprotein
MRTSKLALAGLLGTLLLSACHPSYPKCNNDKDCKEHEFCVNGICQQCRTDDNCPSGQKCNQGRCETAPPAPIGCTDDSQCPPDQSCIEGHCRACQSNDQCGEGGKCNRGRCARATASSVPPVAAGECKLEPVYFDFNESILSTEATSAIDRDAECLKKAPDRPVTLIGHSDPRGTEEYNLALSDKRAQSVRDRIQRMGVGSALKVVSKGELEATGTDESGWAKDRRADVQW